MQVPEPSVELSPMEIANFNALTLRNLVAGSMRRRAERMLKLDESDLHPAVKAEMLAAEILQATEFLARAHISVRTWAQRNRELF